MLALRRMTHTAFGTLMTLEPAMGLLLGLLVLSQQRRAIQIAGIDLVVLAALTAAEASHTGTPRHKLTPRSRYGGCFATAERSYAGLRRRVPVSPHPDAGLAEVIAQLARLLPPWC